MRPKNLEKEAAIRQMALKIIAEDGMENLTMQKLAIAANISPRTIYIKYENKEDFLVRLFIDEVFGPYEKAVLTTFKEEMELEVGMKLIWLNAFRYLINNPHHFALMRHSLTSPMLNKAFKEKGIKEGEYFAPIHRFINKHVASGLIIKLPFEVHRALINATLLDLVNEYIEHTDRAEQIITEEILMTCCEIILKGLKK